LIFGSDMNLGGCSAADETKGVPVAHVEGYCGKGESR
jgi:hypothetical protein